MDTIIKVPRKKINKKLKNKNKFIITNNDKG